MPNPSGIDFTASVALNTDPVTGQPYVWADGDVYQLPQTDQAEGAAFGASFNGLGVMNQPASRLLNKINLIRSGQIADEVNITALLARNTWKNMQAWTIPGTFTLSSPPPSFRFVVVGGGAGGAGSLNTSGNYTSGGGGGAGCYQEGVWLPGAAGALTIVVGSGGAGGAPGGNGSAGTQSSLGFGAPLIISQAGTPAAWGGAGGFCYGGLGGGSGTLFGVVGALSLLSMNGGIGSDGQSTSGSNVYILAGNGAPGPYGGGGRAANSPGGPYQKGAAPGAGGGGFYGGNGSAGNGAPGIVVIYW